LGVGGAAAEDHSGEVGLAVVIEGDEAGEGDRPVGEVPSLAVDRVAGESTRLSWRGSSAGRVTRKNGWRRAVPVFIAR
jgi:hypothetical protein